MHTSTLTSTGTVNLWPPLEWPPPTRTTSHTPFSRAVGETVTMPGSSSVQSLVLSFLTTLNLTHLSVVLNNFPAEAGVRGTTRGSLWEEGW